MTPSFARFSVFLLGSLGLLGESGCQRDPLPQQMASQTAPAATSPTASAGDMTSLQPDELARMLGQPGDKPLLFHVGFKKLYQQAHIPGSEFLGPASDSDGLARLRHRVADLPRTANIVLYCGCCPWERCPNMKSAYRALHDLGFTSAKVLFIPHDLGADWVDKGFPVAKGD